MEAAQADTESVQAAGDLARITVVADVVRSYVEQCSAAEELRIAQQSLALQKQRVDVSRRLRDAGRGNQPDVTRGQTQVDTLSADIPRYTARRKIAQYRLAALLARAPSDLPPAVLACDRLPQIHQPIPVGDGAALLKRRPDVREAERQLAASTARIGVATGALYPTVSIGASAGYDRRSRRPRHELPTARWAFGPLISWTFPTNGARGRVREARGVEQRRAREVRRRGADRAARNRDQPRHLRIRLCARRCSARRAEIGERVGATKRTGCIWPDASRSSRIWTRPAR